jgi:hypothetical protein
MAEKRHFGFQRGVIAAGRFRPARRPLGRWGRSDGLAGLAILRLAFFGTMP